MCKFTVCIPSYNRAHTIQKPLDSLVKQTFKDFEVVVIDDGSSDNTEEVVHQYESLLNLRYIKKVNGGKHTALNRGVACAKGELFVILDSDDQFVPTCLGKMAKLWDRCKDKDSFCGVMGKSMTNGKMIGRPFPEGLHSLSYVEYHYGNYAGWFLDCCECLRTDILKKYSWPENLETKFVPENYVMDQIGLKYKLLLTNEIFKNAVYEDDGITNNADDYVKKNICGYLFNAISKIEIILLKAKKAELKPTAGKYMWCYYWQLVKMDAEQKGPRIKHISLLGYAMWFRYNLVQIVKSILRK